MKSDLESAPGLYLTELFHDRKLKEEKFRSVMAKCYDYTNNWTDDELGQWSAELRKALGPDKPALSFNEIRRFVNRVAGTIAGSRLDEKAYPRDDDSDWMIADILTDLLKQVRDENSADELYTQVFRDSYIASRGFLRVEWSNEVDPFGSIVYRHVDPRRVFIIGEGSRLDLLDRRGLLEVIPMTWDDIVARWPKFKGKLESLKRQVTDTDSVASGGDYKLPVELRDTVYEVDEDCYNVLRYQCFKWVDVKFLRSGNDLTEAPVDDDEMQAVVDLARQNGLPVEVVKVKQRRVKVYYAVGDVDLESEWSQYKHNRWDLVPCIAYNDGGRITGVVQDLLDPQDEKNKRRSQIINILIAANSGSYFVKEGSLADPDKAQAQLGKARQMIMIQGDLNNAIRPADMNLTAIPAIIGQELQSTNDMKEVSGIGDASLGVVPEGVTSGRGIQSLQGPTETIIAELFQHFVFFRKQVAYLTVSLIQQFYTEQRRVRILGDYQKNYQPQNEQLAAQIQQGLVSFEDGMKTILINKREFDRKLNDVTVGRYDIVIDLQAFAPTMRQSQFFQLQSMKAQGAPVKWSTIIKSWDGRGKMDALRDALEAESMMGGQGVMPQMVGAPQNATPPLPDDLGRNLMGMQA